MGKILDSIDDSLQEWIGHQKMFFVATAPLAPDGFINCSPKGGDCFRTLGPHEVVYHDLTGSGVETISHLKENGRIVLMFCAFEGPPKIVRLHGIGTVITRVNPRFSEMCSKFEVNNATRAFIHIQVNRISDSCGFTVPLYDYHSQREIFDRLSERKTSEEYCEYRLKKNASSIDGLPGLSADEA